MSTLVFMDTETTGLALDDDVWEFAAIRRETSGDESRYSVFVEHDTMRCRTLPDSFRRDHSARYDGGSALTRRQFASFLDKLLSDRPHVVGAVPNFDTERLALLLRGSGYEPGWHYHLIDVENLAVGYLAARGVYVPLPWDSDELSRRCGVEPPTDARHTAMGDAEWAMRLYDAVMATT